MGWCFCQNGDCNGCDTKRVKGDGGIIQISQHVHTECVDHGMGEEHCCINSNCLRSRGFVGGLYGCSDRDESCATKGDTCCNCDLTEEVEPLHC